MAAALVFGRDAQVEQVRLAGGRAEHAVTQQLRARLPHGATLLRWPVVRWQGLHPFAAIVRAADGAEPPVVPVADEQAAAEYVARLARDRGWGRVAYHDHPLVGPIAAALP